MKREDLIEIAIQKLEGNDFDRFVFELLSRNLYPGLNPTSISGDLGEDARTEHSTLFLHNGKWISLATSKEKKWRKVKNDCERCTITNRNIDILVFVTAGKLQQKTIDKWKQKVKDTYKWELEVRTIEFLAPYASRCDYEDLVDQHLHVPPLGGDFIHEIERQFDKETQRAIRNISSLIPGIDTPIEREEIKRIEDQILLGNAVLFTGEAGTGKSAIASRLAKNSYKPTLFLDARRLAKIENDTGLRNHFGIKGSIEDSILRLAKNKGCRVIIDQIDNSIGLKISDLLIDLAEEIINQDGVDVIMISRKREIHEFRFLDKIAQRGDVVELLSNPINSKVIKNILSRLGIKNPSINLVEMGKNLLNLEIIGRIIHDKGEISSDDITNEIDLWEEYVKVIREREGNRGDAIIAESIKYSNVGIRANDRSFICDIQKSHEFKRLESWKIIVCDYGRIYRFYHEKFQDYLYAFDATERGLSKNNVIDELGDSHRTRNICLLIQDIYHRNNPSRLPQYLREVWNV